MIIFKISLHLPDVFKLQRKAHYQAEAGVFYCAIRQNESEIIPYF